jgi:hypothetical protein
MQRRQGCTSEDAAELEILPHRMVSECTQLVLEAGRDVSLASTNPGAADSKLQSPTCHFNVFQKQAVEKARLGAAQVGDGDGRLLPAVGQPEAVARDLRPADAVPARLALRPPEPLRIHLLAQPCGATTDRDVPLNIELAATAWTSPHPRPCLGLRRRDIFGLLWFPPLKTPCLHLVPAVRLQRPLPLVWYVSVRGLSHWVPPDVSCWLGQPNSWVPMT